jgi:hypothetical protein
VKKSEIYHALQIVVVKCPHLCCDTEESALEVLRELFVQEDLAKYQEKLEDEQE